TASSPATATSRCPASSGPCSRPATAACSTWSSSARASRTRATRTRAGVRSTTSARSSAPSAPDPPDRKCWTPMGRDVDRLTRSRNAVAVEAPETQFAQVGEDRVAYQVFGDGPPDVVYMQGVTETIDLRWEWPPYAHFLRRLASFSRVVTFDQRGQG